MKYSGLTKAAAWYTASNLFVRSANFLLLPLYSNFISPDEFGTYALLMSFYSFAMVLFQGGFQSAMTRFFLKEKDSDLQERIYASIGRTALITALVLFVLTLFYSRDISLVLFRNITNNHLINFIAAALLLETIAALGINYLVTVQKASRVAAVSAAGAVLNFILNIYLIYFLHLGITGIILAQISSAVILIILLTPILLKIFTLKGEPSVQKKLFKYTYPLITGGLLSIGVDVADRFIINYYLGKEEVGIYSFSYRLALIMNLFVISFRTAWTPHSLTQYYTHSYSREFGQTFLKYIAAAGLIFLPVVLLSKDLFDVNISGFSLFNKAYANGVIIIPFVIAGYFMSGISSFYSVYPYVSDKTYHFLLSDGTAFIVNVCTNLILVPLCICWIQ